jgi:hypothetical protein
MIITAIRAIGLNAVYDDGRVACTAADFVHWFGRDPGRPGRSTALVCFLGGRIGPVATPDHPDGVVAELTSRGVAVSSR